MAKDQSLSEKRVDCAAAAAEDAIRPACARGTQAAGLPAASNSDRAGCSGVSTWPKGRSGGPAAVARRADLEAALARALAGQAEAVAEREAVVTSTLWRVTQPLREAAAIIPISIRVLPRRVLRLGYKLATLQFGSILARARITQTETDTVRPRLSTDSGYDAWVKACDTLTDEDREAIRTHVDHLAYRPLISLVLRSPASGPDGMAERRLHETIASVQAQLYPHWELWIIESEPSLQSAPSPLGAERPDDPRIKRMRADPGASAAAAGNASLAKASGAFVVLLTPGERLAEDALYEVAVDLNAHPDADLIYSDEDQTGPSTGRLRPYFKPDWSIDVLLGGNLVGSTGVFRRSLVERLGGLREEVIEAAQDYDLALRCAAVTDVARIRHIPAILVHRPEPAETTPHGDEPPTAAAGEQRQPVIDYLRRQGAEAAEVLPAPDAPGANRIRWPLPDAPPRVSLIVPTRDRADLLAQCASGLLHRTDYDDLELLIVDNDSRDPDALALMARLTNDRRVRLLRFPGPFNYAALNNAAVRAASGEVIVLVNSDIDVISGDWLREMVSLAIRPDIGAVGAKLRFADGRIQHAGIVLGVGDDAIAGHYGYLASADDHGYGNRFVLTQEVSAVTGACLAVRRAVFEAVEGLDAEHLPVQYNDVDFCLRIRERGWRVIWTPFAELYHLESASRGGERTPEQRARAEREARYMRSRWGAVLDSDPFYNPNFDREDHSFMLAVPPRRKKPWTR